MLLKILKRNTIFHKFSLQQISDFFFYNISMFVDKEKQSLCNSAIMLKIANWDLGNRKLNVIVTVQNSNPVFVSSSK